MSTVLRILPLSASTTKSHVFGVTLYHEGTSLNPLTGTSNQSYERRPGGGTACYDTDNNTADFVPA